MTENIEKKSEKLKKQLGKPAQMLRNKKLNNYEQKVQLKIEEGKDNGDLKFLPVSEGSETNFVLVPVYSTRQKVFKTVGKTPIGKLKKPLIQFFRYMKKHYPIDLRLGWIKKYELIEEGKIYRQTVIGKFALVVFALGIGIFIMLI